MGLVFEKMCKDYLIYYADNLPVSLRAVRQWWGTDAVTRKRVQIDIVGTPIEGTEYIKSTIFISFQKMDLQKD